MPCGSGTRTEDARLLQVASAAAPSAAAAAAPSCPQQSRFHVSHMTFLCQQEDTANAGTSEHRLGAPDEAGNAAAEPLSRWDQQCEQLHLAVGILDSLPWCHRAGGGCAGGGGGGSHQLSPVQAAAAVATVTAAAMAFQAIPELEENPAAAGTRGAAETEVHQLLGDVADGCTLTAQMGKSISHVGLSASSSNFPSLDCRCCGGDSDALEPPPLPLPPSAPPPPPPPPQHQQAPSPAAAAAAAAAGDASSHHLEPPWSNNSCCRSVSHRPGSPVSLRQLAACHRSERVGPTLARSASYRRRPSSGAQQLLAQQLHQSSGGGTTAGGTPDCCLPRAEADRHQSYQEYLDQLHERVHRWLLETASSPSDEAAATTDFEGSWTPPDDG